MKVTSITEHEDGSATIMVNMSEEEKHALISSAVIIGLTEGLKLKETQSIEEFKNA